MRCFHKLYVYKLKNDRKYKNKLKLKQVRKLGEPKAQPLTQKTLYLTFPEFFRNFE